MVDDTARASRGSAHRDMKAEIDERRIAHAVAIGLPSVTVIVAAVMGVTIGAPMAILVLAAGVLLGVIGLFWASLRILSGDAALPPELEALDASAHAVDALASRKKMLLRALKDLDNERALGKLEEEDHEQLSLTYRGELKDVLARIDATLQPHRKKAEDAARSYLAKAGLAEEGYRGTQPVTDEDALSDDEMDDDDSADDDDDDDDAEESEPVVAKPVARPAAKKVAKSENDATTVVAKKTDAAPARVACPKCETSNEVDASFCKKCGASLANASKAASSTSSTSTSESAAKETESDEA